MSTKKVIKGSEALAMNENVQSALKVLLNADKETLRKVRSKISDAIPKKPQHKSSINRREVVAGIKANIQKPKTVWEILRFTFLDFAGVDVATLTNTKGLPNQSKVTKAIKANVSKLKPFLETLRTEKQEDKDINAAHVISVLNSYKTFLSLFTPKALENAETKGLGYGSAVRVIMDHAVRTKQEYAKALQRMQKRKANAEKRKEAQKRLEAQIEARLRAELKAEFQQS